VHTITDYHRDHGNLMEELLFQDNSHRATIQINGKCPGGNTTDYIITNDKYWYGRSMDSDSEDEQ
jgi:hypothetical protein